MVLLLALLVAKLFFCASDLTFFGFPSALQLSLNQRLNKFKQSCRSVLNQSEMAFKE